MAKKLYEMTDEELDEHLKGRTTEELSKILDQSERELAEGRIKNAKMLEKNRIENDKFLREQLEIMEKTNNEGLTPAQEKLIASQTPEISKSTTNYMIIVAAVAGVCVFLGTGNIAYTIVGACVGVLIGRALEKD